MKLASRYCGYCEKKILAEGEPVNHLLHFIITMTTCGCWGLVWLCLIVFPISMHCTKCGKKV